MNTERLIMLENVSGQMIGLTDTQGRSYRLGVDGKIRISEVSLQDILDYRPSKTIFDREMVKIHNADASKLYAMGLTEEEIVKYSAASTTPTIVITEAIKEPVVEVVVEEAPVEEIVEEIVEEVKPVEETVEVKEEVIPTPVVVNKKPSNKKSTAKKSSRK